MSDVQKPAANDVASKIISNVNKVIVGKDEQIKLLMVALLVGGHVLLEDVPGTGKTKTARALAQSLDLKFKRIQFTIDLLPSDLTGIHYFDRSADKFVFREGPIFTNILLADEINRATARTQSSLLECMEEKQVTVDGETRILPPPFLVIATQNPIESQGTFSLPEAQLDRFLLMLSMNYPTHEESIAILKRFSTDDPLTTLESVATPDELLAMQKEAKEVYVADCIYDYATAIVEATRNSQEVRIGASPRALLALVSAAKALALLSGRSFVTPDDIKELSVPVLAHRLSMHASGALSKDGGIQTQHDHASSVINSILESVACPTEDFSNK